MNQYSELARKYSTRSASPHNFILRRLMLASVSALAVSTASTQVMAQCEPDLPEDGDEVVCNDTDNDGFFSDANNLSIEISSDAVVTGNTGRPGSFGDPTILLGGDNLTIQNDGVIIRQSGQIGAITIEGASVNFINNGAIIDMAGSGANAFPVFLAGSDITFTNNGIITANHPILLFGDEITFINGDNGEIHTGIVARIGSSTIINQGNIERGIAVEANNVTIRNNENARVAGIGAGIGGTFVENNGVIEIGLSIGGTAENRSNAINGVSGTIEGTLSAVSIGFADVTNFGLIRRTPGSSTNINQSGLVRLSAGANLLNQSTGLISTEGMLRFSNFAIRSEAPNTSVTNFGEIRSNAGGIGGIFVNAEITNAGTISSADANGFLNLPIGFAVPEFLIGGGINIVVFESTISNSGSISAPETAVSIYGANTTFYNSGIISVSNLASGSAVILTGDDSSRFAPDATNEVLRFVNELDGMILATQPNGIAVAISSNDNVRTFVENHGIIDAGAIGINGSDSTEAIENSGLISGDIFLYGGGDVFSNTSGIVDGNLFLGGGNDVYNQLASGVVTGALSGGDGFDIATFEQIYGDFSPVSFSGFEQLNLFIDENLRVETNLELIGTPGELLVEQGQLILNSVANYNITVSRSATLSGTGSILGSVLTGGVIAPGASIGELTINGDLLLNPNSVLSIEFDDGIGDALTVVGDVLIDDAILEFTPLGNGVSSIQSFEFLNGNSVTGEFSAISFNGFTGFADLTFANGVLGVTITPQFEFSSSLTTNSVAVAGYLNDLIIADSVNSSAEDVVSTLFSLSTDNAALNAAMLSLQPEAFAATAAISVENTILVNDIIRDRAGIENDRENGKYFWLSGAGGFANYEGDLGDDGTSSFITNSRSIIGGAEIVRGDALIGIYGGKVESDQDLRTGLSQTETDGFVTGGYGAWRTGEFSNMASFGYVFGEAESLRAIPALSEQLQSDYDLDSFTAQGRSQYDFTVNELLFSPFVGATYVRSDRGTVVESGGSSALHVSDQSESFLFLDVGSAIEKQFSINDRTKARAALFAGWRYEALGHSIDANSGIGIDGPFGLTGTAAAFERSRLLVGGDGSINVGENISVFAKYRGEFGGDYTSNRVSGGLAVRF